jgi:hypothetical protein
MAAIAGGSYNGWLLQRATVTAGGCFNGLWSWRMAVTPDGRLLQPAAK